MPLTQLSRVSPAPGSSDQIRFPFSVRWQCTAQFACSKTRFHVQPGLATRHSSPSQHQSRNAQLSVVTPRIARERLSKSAVDEFAQKPRRPGCFTGGETRGERLRQQEAVPQSLTRALEIDDHGLMSNSVRSFSTNSSVDKNHALA